MEPARDPRAPCLIGVARKTWHPEDVGADGAPEPLAMWEEVARAAAEDVLGSAERSGMSATAGKPGALWADLQSVRVVYCQSWQYDDPVARVCERLGADPKDRVYSGIGGSIPLVLAAELAEDIARGEVDLGLVLGAEALATARRIKKAGERPSWSFRPSERRPFPYDIPFHDAETTHGIFQAYLTFALFDSARRAHLGRSATDHARVVGSELAGLTAVAGADPEHAWFPQQRSAQEITTPSRENRMVAYPYTKLMTSFMDVDMGAALVFASDAKADQLGVPPERRIYLRGWAHAEDPNYVAERRELWRSPAMAVTARQALAAAGLAPSDVGNAVTDLDLYSCFASSLGFAADVLRLDEQDFPEVTVTGGLPYHGGPGSNYMTHAIAAMTERLRARRASGTGAPDFGLTSGVGMHMTRHAYGLWSTEPGPLVPCDRAALAGEVAANLAVAPLVVTTDGPATVAAYTVLHDAQGAAEWAALVCDLPDGTRAYARLEDPDALAEAEETELVGRHVQLDPDEKGVNRASLA